MHLLSNVTVASYSWNSHCIYNYSTSKLISNFVIYDYCAPLFVIVMILFTRSTLTFFVSFQFILPCIIDTCQHLYRPYIMQANLHRPMMQISLHNLHWLKYYLFIIYVHWFQIIVDSHWEKRLIVCWFIFHNKSPTL